MNKLAVMLIGAFAASATAANACDGDIVGRYNTVISPRDTFSSSGQRLGSVAAIIQQDRANYHRFGRRDRGDGYDDMFHSAASRALIPRWLSTRWVPPVVANAIRRGSARITVQVYEGCMAAVFSD
jgi:hypothetical protein